MNSCFMFGYSACPESILPMIEEAIEKYYSKYMITVFISTIQKLIGVFSKTKKQVFTLKIWQKIFCAVLVVSLVVAVVLFFNQEQKNCCLCNSFRYHAPCLIDLKTGELIELRLYFPHKTNVAELADPQPEINTFSFVRLGNVIGTKLTDSKIIEMDIPICEKTTTPALCKNCRKQLGGLLLGRYVLADLYNKENKSIIPIKDGLCLNLRCYEIAAQKENDVLNVTIKGNLD